MSSIFSGFFADFFVPLPLVAVAVAVAASAAAGRDFFDLVTTSHLSDMIGSGCGSLENCGYL